MNHDLSTDKIIQDLPYWIALANMPFIMTPQRFFKLLPIFQSAKNIFFANENDLTINNYLPTDSAKNFVLQRKKIMLENIIEDISKNDISVIHFNDPQYPPLLKQIPDPPYIIFYQGNIQCFNSQALAVVGSRIPSHYGKTVITLLLPEIVRNNIAIVSGLARGIDSLAHQITAQNKGKTISVLGAGHAAPLTAQQIRVKKEIINNHGLIISELPPLFNATKYSFPKRNRIIAALATGTLIIEATTRSGSLITANYSKQYQRKIYAVPGNIFYENCGGTHLLIQHGANLVTCPQDILKDFFQPSDKTVSVQVSLLSEEVPLYQTIRQQPMTIDQISQKLRLPQQEINATLIKMEITGKITQTANGEYRITHTP